MGSLLYIHYVHTVLYCTFMTWVFNIKLVDRDPKQSTPWTHHSHFRCHASRHAPFENSCNMQLFTPLNKNFKKKNVNQQRDPSDIDFSSPVISCHPGLDRTVQPLKCSRAIHIATPASSCRHPPPSPLHPSPARRLDALSSLPRASTLHPQHP
jgi:hypothetical protein